MLMSNVISAAAMLDAARLKLNPQNVHYKNIWKSGFPAILQYTLCIKIDLT
jgi:hypothetical protein